MPRSQSLLGNLLVDTLASYRLVKLVRDDRVTAPVRNRVIERHGPPEASNTSYLLHCPWCLSFYFGAALTMGRQLAPGMTNAIARTFAVSALTGIASQYLDRE